MNQKKLANIVLAFAIIIPLIILVIFGKKFFSFNLDGNPFSGGRIPLNSGNISTGISLKTYNFENINGKLYLGNIKNYSFYDDILRSAKKTLDIEIYDITYADIKKALRELGQDGVKQRIITEKNKYKESENDFEKLHDQLSETGISLKSDDGLKIKYLHSKFIIIDNSKFLIQTANFTYSSFFNNNEAFFVSDDKSILNALKYIFDSDWNAHEISEFSIPANLLVCEIDCRKKLEALLGSAQKSVYIMHQDLEDENIINILKDKKNLDFKAILAENDENKKNISLFGNDKIKLISKPYNHIKSILIDDKYLIIGSMNLTQNSIDNNREISIVLTNSDLISQYKKFFDASWK